MRIALTYNEKRSASEAEAEFDSPETIHAIARMLASLGHTVTPIEVGKPVEALVAELRRMSPDLVFNMAEGQVGTCREAFYPMLFEHLGLRHTGSPPSVLALCLDKAMAKKIVAAARVHTPRAQLVRRLDELRPVTGKVIVKPNFEGSSKGITQGSVVDAAHGEAALREVVAAALARYPAGVLVEEFVEGMDVSVGFVDGLGLLAPIGYSYAADGPHQIYDLALKQGAPERITVHVPAPLDELTTSRLVAAAKRAFAALGVVGYGRADFRVTPDGKPEFLEINPLPSLAPRERDLYAAAAPLGKAARDLLAYIVTAAA
ncbi:MAG TPA: ATP-grasp domain-containing protein [Kofleriaceae bacterium]